MRLPHQPATRRTNNNHIVDSDESVGSKRGEEKWDGFADEPLVVAFQTTGTSFSTDGEFSINETNKKTTGSSFSSVEIDDMVFVSTPEKAVEKNSPDVNSTGSDIRVTSSCGEEKHGTGNKRFLSDSNNTDENHCLNDDDYSTRAIV
jgi:hypothetical protein